MFSKFFSTRAEASVDAGASASLQERALSSAHLQQGFVSLPQTLPSTQPPEQDEPRPLPPFLVRAAANLFCHSLKDVKVTRWTVKNVTNGNSSSGASTHWPEYEIALRFEPVDLEQTTIDAGATTTDAGATSDSCEAASVLQLSPRGEQQRGRERFPWATSGNQNASGCRGTTGNTNIIFTTTSSGGQEDQGGVSDSAAAHPPNSTTSRRSRVAPVDDEGPVDEIMAYTQHVQVEGGSPTSPSLPSSRSSYASRVSPVEVDLHIQHSLHPGDGVPATFFPVAPPIPGGIRTPQGLVVGEGRSSGNVASRGPSGGCGSRGGTTTSIAAVHPEVVGARSLQDHLALVLRDDLAATSELHAQRSAENMAKRISGFLTSCTRLAAPAAGGGKSGGPPRKHDNSGDVALLDVAPAPSYLGRSPTKNGPANFPAGQMLRTVRMTRSDAEILEFLGRLRESPAKNDFRNSAKRFLLPKRRKAIKDLDVIFLEEWTQILNGAIKEAVAFLQEGLEKPEVGLRALE